MNNCIVCITSGKIVAAIHDNKLCQACFDAALAAIVATDRRGKSECIPPKVAARRERRLRRERAI